MLMIILYIFCFCSTFDPDSVTPTVELTNDLRQQNTLAFLHDRLLTQDLKVFQSILAFLDINKVSKDVVEGFTIMQKAAMYGLHEFVNALLQGTVIYQNTVFGWISMRIKL